MNLIYADGSALSMVLSSEPEAVSWMRFADENAARLVTSPLGLTELRHTARTMDAVARAKAHDVAERMVVVRFFDQSFEPAAMVTGVLDPFRAMHLGVAVAHPDVDALATYDVLLARVAAIHDLRVVSPGRADGWWEA